MRLRKGTKSIHIGKHDQVLGVFMTHKNEGSGLALLNVRGSNFPSLKNKYAYMIRDDKILFTPTAKTGDQLEVVYTTIHRI